MYLFLHVSTSVTFIVFSISCNASIEIFLHCSERSLNSSILMPFSASAVFCFISSTLMKHFPLRTFFIWGNKENCSGQDWVNREGRAWGSCQFFGRKLLNTQCDVGRCACKSPIMKWANALKSLKKNSLKLNTTSHNTTSWYI